MNPFEALQGLLRRLPFRHDDFDEVNAIYASWSRTQRASDAHHIDLWTYCYIWRYLLVKFTREHALDYVELDALLARIYEQVVTKRHTLRTNERYASWVSVVCHNLFVNYVRSGRPVLIHGLRGASLMSLPKEEAEEDVVVLFRAITSAIERLPGYLRPIAELRLVHERSYEEIAFLLDKNVVVVRSYVNKALNRLRQDPYFMAFCRIHYEEELERVATASGSSVSENSG